MRRSGVFPPDPRRCRLLFLLAGRGGIGNTILGLLVVGLLNNGLDHVAIDSFMKILIRGLILLAAPIINVYAQRLHERVPGGQGLGPWTPLPHSLGRCAAQGRGAGRIRDGWRALMRPTATTVQKSTARCSRW